jgi:phosphorylated CTD-interacting factor 1
LVDSIVSLYIYKNKTRVIDSKLEEGNRTLHSDPVLSGQVTTQYASSQRLMEEICETGQKRTDAKRWVQDLCRRTQTAVREMAQQMTLHGSSAGGQQAVAAPIKKGDRIDLEGHAPVYTLVYHRKKWKKPFCIKLNSTHYDKLRSMFVRVHGWDGTDIRWLQVATGKPTMTMHAFHLILMVLLLRYSSLSGGQLLLDLRGGGMQGAIHGDVFHVLHEIFPQDSLMECFGSPLNAYLASFGSAFPTDLDWHFGSIGNFLEVPIVEGCCEANPPFAPGMMSAMVDRMFLNLALADEKKTALTFVVVVPNAGDDHDSQRAVVKRFGGVSLQQMTSGTHCRLHILLSAKEHGYVEGAQHMRPTRYKESLYDTSIVVLQSNVAFQRGFDTSGLDTKIRHAFVSRHRFEVEQRKNSVMNNESDEI